MHLLFIRHPEWTLLSSYKNKTLEHDALSFEEKMQLYEIYPFTGRRPITST